MGISKINIKELVAGLSVKIINPANIEVTGIKANSKNILPGDMFAAIKGVHSDGVMFTAEAVAKGASCVLVHSGSSFESHAAKFAHIPFIIADDLNTVTAEMALRVYKNPSREMSVIGVTGTNGKTTICYMLESVFLKKKQLAGVIGTINYRYAGKTVDAPNTTPQSVDLQRLLSDMRHAGVKTVCMEVSSHSLVLKRVYGVQFDVGIFTNLTKEHLDFHKTIEEYCEAKKLLFTEYLGRQSLKAKKSAIINVDDQWGRKLACEAAVPVITYGLTEKAHITANIINVDLHGINMEILYANKNYPLQIKLLGRHNAYNAMSVFGACTALGLKPEEICEGLSALENVPGRMEWIDEGQPYKVIVDFAHTEDALVKVLSCIRSLNPKRVITVFGCGGNRDRTKRPRMGIVATELSDWVMVTSDNPRDEDPMFIISEIEAGIKQTGRTNYNIYPDREEAIRQAMSIARPGDAVVLAGKGHEPYQIIGNKYLEFDDRNMARKYIKKC